MTEQLTDRADARAAEKNQESGNALRSDALNGLAAAPESKGTANTNIAKAENAKVIEVPPLAELDDKSWRCHPEHKTGLPGEYLPRVRQQEAPDPRVAAALDNIKAEDVQKRINELSGKEEAVIEGKPVRIESRSTYGGYENGLQYMKDKFEKAGFKVVEDTYTKSGETFHNLRAIKLGNTKPNEVVLYGAHIDSTAGNPWEGAEPQAPGADDDGSGSVALSEIAGAMKDLPLDRTVVFALFSGEEQGLWGSRAMAEMYKQGKDQVSSDLDKLGVQNASSKTKIVGMYQMDMVGYAPKGNTLESHDTSDNQADHHLTDILNANQQRYGIDLKVYGAHNDNLNNRSDHYSFERTGVPAVLLSEPYDTADQENPNYHSTNDTADTVNVPYLVNVAKLAAAAGIELAGLQSQGIK